MRGKISSIQLKVDKKELAKLSQALEEIIPSEAPRFRFEDGDVSDSHAAA